MLCYEKLFKEMVVPRQSMDPPVVMTKLLFEGNEDMWRVVRAKSPTIIRLFQMNGFELYPCFEAKTKEVDLRGGSGVQLIECTNCMQDTVELRGIPKNIEGMGADDLVELVRLIVKVCDKDSLSIPPDTPTVRPERIASYFVSEANRITTEDMGDILVLFCFVCGWFFFFGLFYSFILFVFLLVGLFMVDYD
jgi:hypothetical protein